METKKKCFVCHEPRRGAITNNSDGSAAAASSFTNYPNNSSADVKDAISKIVKIGNRVSIKGNFYINGCYGGKGAVGDKIGQKISSLVMNRSLFLNTGLGKGTIAIDHTAFPTFATPGVKKFSNGSVHAIGTVQISRNGEPFSFINK